MNRGEALASIEHPLIDCMKALRSIEDPLMNRGEALVAGGNPLIDCRKALHPIGEPLMNREKALKSPGNPLNTHEKPLHLPLPKMPNQIQTHSLIKQNNQQIIQRMKDHARPKRSTFFIKIAKQQT